MTSKEKTEVIIAIIFCSTVSAFVSNRWGHHAADKWWEEHPKCFTVTGTDEVDPAIQGEYAANLAQFFGKQCKRDTWIVTDEHGYYFASVLVPHKVRSYTLVDSRGDTFTLVSSPQPH